MRHFDVACYNKISGRIAWSMTQEAYTAAQAVAKACLPVEQRPEFVSDYLDANQDELTVDHPAVDMSDGFTVRAEVIP
jgi:hypothetical protein